MYMTTALWIQYIPTEQFGLVTNESSVNYTPEIKFLWVVVEADLKIYSVFHASELPETMAHHKTILLVYI